MSGSGEERGWKRRETNKSSAGRVRIGKVGTGTKTPKPAPAPGGQVKSSQGEARRGKVPYLDYVARAGSSVEQGLIARAGSPIRESSAGANPIQVPRGSDKERQPWSVSERHSGRVDSARHSNWGDKNTHRKTERQRESEPGGEGLPQSCACREGVEAKRERAKMGAQMDGKEDEEGSTLSVRGRAGEKGKEAQREDDTDRERDRVREKQRARRYVPLQTPHSDTQRTENKIK
ncbi:hypothetical protein CCHR01_06398 [Colletotrichum chrysophilum]|uniref:Uncharacterized protein n=1 Tax=Colletotrichum chrysophilum TaxID=1836956 RepID=A0AAD9EGV7_9PEZI|nr:hypothetical protein CCHR01_06398 [Colletotrichum chrysophilum]